MAISRKLAGNISIIHYLGPSESMKKIIGAPVPCVYQPVSSSLKTQCPDVSSSALSVLKKLWRKTYFLIYISRSIRCSITLYDPELYHELITIPYIFFRGHRLLRHQQNPSAARPLCVYRLKQTLNRICICAIFRHWVGIGKSSTMDNNNPIILHRKYYRRQSINDTRA